MVVLIRKLKLKVLDLDKMLYFLIIFKNSLICCHFGPPLAPVVPWCMHDFRLDSSHLFYLRNFITTKLNLQRLNK